MVTAYRSDPRRHRRRVVWVCVGALAVTGIVILAVSAVNLFLGPPLIHVGRGPDAPAVTPDGRTLYVANLNDNTVAVISLKG
jgi:DNA-binding beta-propeller fold protein YncE